MTELNMHLLCQLQCNDCGIDRADKVNGEILYELSSKSSVDSKSTSFIVVLQSKLFNFKLKKFKYNRNIGMIDFKTKQQVQQFGQLSRSNSDIYLNNMQMARKVADNQQRFSDNKQCPRDDGQLSNGQSHTLLPESIDGGKHFSNPADDDAYRYLWSDTATIPHQSNHSNQLVCSKRYINIHRDDNHNAIANILHKQKCNSFSTKLAGESTVRTTESALLFDNSGDGVKGCDCSLPFANSLNKQQMANENENRNNKLHGNTTSLPHKTSLKHVNRSPLTIVHRSNLLQIFIKYLLILNCFVCVASGNLMSRNIGNDLSSKHNQTNVETATTSLNGTTLINGRSKPILTTSSPLILHSIMSSNRSLFPGSDMQSQENANGQRQPKHFPHLHLTPEAMPPAHYASDAANPHQMPSSDDNSGEDVTRCASCQIREQLKAQNLASIKMHILARLSMTHPPNITQRPKISEQILENFYQNNGFRYIRVRNDSNEFGAFQRDDIDDGVNEMQGDDPNASANKHQHHHMHEYHRNGGIKSGLHEQHHHHASSYHHINRNSRYICIGFLSCILLEIF